MEVISPSQRLFILQHTLPSVRVLQRISSMHQQVLLCSVWFSESVRSHVTVLDSLSLSLSECSIHGNFRENFIKELFILFKMGLTNERSNPQFIVIACIVL
ncbi:hypothetical protein OESDEN_16846 [Oesophagostomum dentatum]|uniref:Uncharacterized protein n=1 Tax=Oesophagostomum dentatum TaxID=61180 RepID=A0A0B1SIV3_OESDE|nr:hypothetical protein OESDEN_16846 [Oesophagostomum dentatum]